MAKLSYDEKAGIGVDVKHIAALTDFMWALSCSNVGIEMLSEESLSWMLDLQLRLVGELSTRINDLEVAS